MDTIDEGITALTDKVKNADDLVNKQKILEKMKYKIMSQEAVLFGRSKFAVNVLYS